MMDILNSIDRKISSFVDAGGTSLSNFQLSKHSDTKLKALQANGDEEESVKFRLNQTGNIFYAMTGDKLEQETKELFDSVTVLFSAMTKAMSDKGYSLFNYDQWSRLITGSGFFVEVQKFQKNLNIKSGSLAVDTQVVQQLLPGLTTGSSLEIAKNVLNAINGEFSASKEDEKSKFGHLLFICEELFGAPSVTVRLFFASKESHKTLTSSPCHKSTSTSFEQLQEGNTFLFVSPDTIAKYASKFGQHPEEYTNLVENLKKLLDS
ncbi:Zygote formation protein zyg1 [Salmonella enterica subsp. enterica serovar Java]|uniref:Zygote formation protein zyg1 n=1 Tax=Salmonella enterica subsp. enterica serovar Java TaxID=224729 RepID=A0A3Y9C5S9_SALEB|nr:Zygote formation protein zyg1 [Salmonella enterica subsp. enterica serovar Java]ECG3202203.1 Zygote formation protein zyg1 [Salmonella enterica subsp. enterica serovar Java]EDC4058176.1 Zygote formation protein zyg1 [Salmonella enterica subsp. enterica serovar Java]HCA3587959.1 Zygote formation protein zyg1 [Salmonella enterica subsp. enterica serovar Java]